MSLQVLVVHSGDKITAPSTSFESLKALQAWIHKAASIVPHHQILLLPNGKQAKFQELSKEVSDEEIMLVRQITDEPGAA